MVQMEGDATDGEIKTREISEKRDAKQSITIYWNKQNKGRGTDTAGERERGSGRDTTPESRRPYREGREM